MKPEGQPSVVSPPEEDAAILPKRTANRQKSAEGILEKGRIGVKLPAEGYLKAGGWGQNAFVKKSGEIQYRGQLGEEKGARQNERGSKGLD